MVLKVTIREIWVENTWEFLPIFTSPISLTFRKYKVRDRQNKTRQEAGEVARSLRALVDLLEALSSIPSTDTELLTTMYDSTLEGS